MVPLNHWANESETEVSRKYTASEPQVNRTRTASEPQASPTKPKVDKQVHQLQAADAHRVDQMSTRRQP